MARTLLHYLLSPDAQSVADGWVWKSSSTISTATCNGRITLRHMVGVKLSIPALPAGSPSAYSTETLETSLQGAESPPGARSMVPISMQARRF